MKNIFLARWFGAGVLITFGLGACVNGRHLGGDVKSNHFLIEQTSQHCGGAAPDPSVAYPTISPVPGQSYAVYNFDSNGKRKEKMGEITSNDLGLASLSLPDGNYQLWRLDKLLSFEEFQKRNSGFDNPNYTYGDTECFRSWYEGPDFAFQAKGDTVKVLISNRCFVGSHPCLEYSGPYPP